MKRWLIHYSIAGLLAYAGLCTWLYFAQDNLLYLPTPEVSAANASITYLRNGPETIKVWKVGNGSRAVLYFGGNGENVANNIETFRGLLPDTTFYLMNYRGYGGSSGEPAEAAFLEDAALLFDQVSEVHKRVAVIGRSLGSGVATWLAANRPVTRLILVTPFDSVENIAKSEYPFAPVSLLLRDKFRSIDYVPAISAPVLVLLADNDVVIPHHYAMNLVAQFPLEQVRVRILPETTHNTVSQADEYALLIKQFLSEEMPSQTQTAQQAAGATSTL